MVSFLFYEIVGLEESDLAKGGVKNVRWIILGMLLTGQQNEKQAPHLGLVFNLPSRWASFCYQKEVTPMCTALTYKTNDFYFGRTLDYEHGFSEEVTVTPRNFPLHFRHLPPLMKHHAIIGMAKVAQGYPCILMPSMSGALLWRG